MTATKNSSREKNTVKCMESSKHDWTLSGTATSLHFFSETPFSSAKSFQFMNFSDAIFYENYFTSDFHANTVISTEPVCLLVKMASKTVIRPIFLFSATYYATADIPLISENYPTQEDSCRCNLVVVRFSSGFFNFKKGFKALHVPAACKQIASTGLLLSWTFLQKATI